MLSAAQPPPTMVAVAPFRVRPPLGGAEFHVVLLLVAVLGACSHGNDEGAQASAKRPATADAGASSEAAKVCEAAVTLLVRGERKQAEGELERALALDPELAQAHFLLGQLRVGFSTEVVDSTQMSFARRNLELLQQGIASLQRATELEPTNDDYAAWLGRAYHQADDLANARRWLEKATELDPTNPEAHKRLGMVYMAIPETELARSTFEKAMQLEPQDANSPFHLGQLLEVQRDWPGARAAYERAIANNPTQPEFYRKLMVVLERLGDEEAVRAAEVQLQRWTEFEAKLERRQRAVSRTPKDPAALRRLGQAYLEGERWRMAVEWCSKAVLFDPKDVDAHLCCGIARRELEEYEMAEKHLREAEFRAPDLLDAKLELLRLFAASENDAALAELLAKVEREAAADGASLFDLAGVCKEIGRAEDSQRLFAKAAALGVTEAVVPDAEAAKTDAPSGGG